MKIYINKDNEIKAINNTSDTSLIEVEVDRESVFGDKSDFIILNYKYIEDETGYSICPAIDYDKLLYLENKEIIKESKNKISILTEELESITVANTRLHEELKETKLVHSDLIFDIDFRVMDIEDSLGIVPMNIKLIRNTEDYTMSSTAKLLLEKIEDGNYKDKAEIESMAERYLSRNRITIDEYDILMKALDKKELEKTPVTLPEEV